ncbi:MAG: organomercurial lyase [Anaerolineae bacterium]
MQSLTTNDVIQAWTTQDDNLPEEMKKLNENVDLQIGLLQLLANGRPVSAAEAVAQTGFPTDEIRTLFEKLAEHGAEFDTEGRLTGIALSLNPTPHRFRVNGQQLYAWCALDTIFLPGFLGETAVVESTDPVNNAPIRLTITPNGVTEYSPETAVLSITVPGVSCRTDESCGPDTGPQSEACSQMHFFSTHETAVAWLKNRPGIAILTVEEAWQLAQANWLEKKRQMETNGTAVQCAC